MVEGYLLTPPEIYDKLNDRFKFDWDPCPYPKPPNFDSLKMRWGSRNFVNPMFAGGITQWVRKALAEAEEGSLSVLTLPVDGWVNLLIERKVEMIPLGRHDWLHTETGERKKASRPQIAFVVEPGK